MFFFSLFINIQAFFFKKKSEKKKKNSGNTPIQEYFIFNIRYKYIHKREVLVTNKLVLLIKPYKHIK